jgi:hypothetical protein
VIVVADPSPLRYLILIEHTHVLPAMYGHAIVPPAVITELSREHTPNLVRAWVVERPDWLHVQAPRDEQWSRACFGVVHATVPGDSFVVRWRTGSTARSDVRSRRPSTRFAARFECSKRAAQWLVEWGQVAMTIAVKAIYENGVFRPKEPLQLQERTEVEVLIPTQAPSDDDPTGWAAAQSLIGFIDDAPADMAEHHDNYLYGRSRE